MIFKRYIIIPFLLVGVLNLYNAAHSITTEFMEDQFEPVMEVGDNNFAGNIGITFETGRKNK